ncbi:hypothetical protein GCM10028817_12020 [Spirosoma pomorum]
MAHGVIELVRQQLHRAFLVDQLSLGFVNGGTFSEASAKVSISPLDSVDPISKPNWIELNEVFSSFCLILLPDRSHTR